MLEEPGGGWNYFRLMCLLVGGGALAEAQALDWVPRTTLRRWIDRLFPASGRQWWMLPASLLYLAWLGYSWRRALDGSAPHGWFFAAFLSLGLIKLWAYAFHYRGFRAWVLDVFTDPRKLRGLCAAERILGGAMIAAAFALY